LRREQKARVDNNHLLYCFLDLLKNYMQLLNHSSVQLFSSMIFFEDENLLLNL
jgi:hypothetical protein